MSQNIEDSAGENSAGSGQDFMKALRDAKRERVRSGLAAGPSYRGGPLMWFDQAFVRDAALSGTVESEYALRVGATQNSLDVSIVASHLNESDMIIPAGATLTLTLLQGDSADGDFAEVGPTICATAPADGITAGPGELVFRFALGNMCKPWAKVKLVVAGECSGGTVDIGPDLQSQIGGWHGVFCPLASSGFAVRFGHVCLYTLPRGQLAFLAREQNSPRQGRIRIKGDKRLFMLQSPITTSVRYLSDGRHAVWPVPFPYSQASAVLAKAIAPDGTERELVQGKDCVLNGNQLFCVLPAGYSLLIWLNENEEDALQGWHPAPPPCQPAPAPAHHVPPPPDLSRLQQAEERLAALEAAQKEAIEAARKAEADALVKELVQTGKGQQKLLQNLGENLAKSQQAGIEASGAAQISRLEALAASLSQAIARAEDASLKAGQAAAEAGAALKSLQDSLAAIQDAQAQKAQELVATLKADLGNTAGQAVKDAQGHSQQSGNQAARAAASAMQAEARERAASVAADEAQASAKAARAYAATGEAQAQKAQAASEASAASEEESRRLANQAWHSAVTAQLWGRRPGVAAVRCFEDLYHVCSGLYVINPHLNHLHSPSPFMGVWPVESVDDIAFDGLFFIGLPYPEPDQAEDKGCCSATPCGQEPCPGAVCVACPQMGCPCRPQKPGEPENPSQPADPENPQHTANAGGNPCYWLPCDHVHQINQE